MQNYRQKTVGSTVSRALMTSCSSPDVVSNELDGKTEELFDELMPSSVFVQTVHTISVMLLVCFYRHSQYFVSGGGYTFLDKKI